MRTFLQPSYRFSAGICGRCKPDVEEYYVRVAVAWYFAEALARQECAALPWFALADSSGSTDSSGLPAVTLRMALTKAIESRRIPDELKAELRQIRSTLPRRF
ncbi:hypothetical protein [Rothia sp. HMSC064D08]|uniref:hypothetical protein n=1 Tax=Rothia sp. HMSC064D08 TaxID=1715104 RepID=UPI0008A2BB89|nr:hypothetical protein [Rothia sp. HMSC064D08]